MTEVVNTGAVFKLVDEFSSPLQKLVAGLDAACKQSTELQAKLDKLGLGVVVTKMESQWEEISKISSAGVDKILKNMGRLGPESGAIFGQMTEGARISFGEINTSASGLSTGVVEAMKGLKTGSIAEMQGIGAAAPEALGGVLTATVAMQSDVLAEMRALTTGSIEALRGIGAEAPGLFTPIVLEAATAANGAIAELARVNEAVRASVTGMQGMNTEAAAVAARSSGGGAAAAAGAGSGGVGRARHGGPHFGRVGTEIPGGHASLGGGPAMAAAGVIGYGVYEAAEMRDEVNRLMITGQVDAEKWGATRDQLGKLLMDSASLTGFSVKQVGEALSKSERAMSGLDVQTKMSVTKELIPYAAAEARLKETSLAESLQAMVGLAHMTGVYEPDKIRDLARKFSYVSLSTNSSLPQFEKTLSYSMPILRTGMGMDPDTIMALTAVSQNAGITSTKSGTWLRSFFEGSEPAVGGGKAAVKHNNALRDMGLLDNNDMPTWKVTGADGRTDWNASVAKQGGIIQQHLAGVPIDQRMGVVKNIWGERGGASASMLSMSTFVDQFVTLAGKIQKFQGGADALEEYAKDNPLQKGREAWRDFQNLLIDIGDKALPLVNSALTNLDIVLKALPADWEATKALWGARADNAKAALTGDRPPMTEAGRALPDLANQGMFDFLLGRVPGVTSGSIWGSIWNQINPVGTAHAEGAISRPPLSGPDGVREGADRGYAGTPRPNGSTIAPPVPPDPTGGVMGLISYSDPGVRDLENIIYRGTLHAFTDFANGGRSGDGTGAGTGGSGSSGGFTNAAYTTWDSPSGAGGFKSPATSHDLPSMRFGRPHDWGPEHGRSGPGHMPGGSLIDGPINKFAGGKTFDTKSPEVMRRLMGDFGLDKFQAAKVLGNLGHESRGFQDFAEKGGGSGIGWAQWTGPRHREFQAWAAANHLDPRSDEANYGMLKHDLKGKYARGVEALKNGASLEQFERIYEGAGVKAYGSRHAYERRALQDYDRSPAMASGAPASARPSFVPPPRPHTPTPVHTNVHLDGEIIARAVTHHQVAANEFTHSHSMHDRHAHFSPPDTAFG